FLPGLAQALARLLDLGERAIQLLAANRIARVVAHLLHDAAGDLDRALGEGGIDLALDGAVLLGSRAALLQAHEVERRDDEGERDEQHEAAGEQRPPGSLVQQRGDGFHRMASMVARGPFSSRRAARSPRSPARRAARRRTSGPWAATVRATR